MKSMIVKSIIKVLNIYEDPEDIVQMMEQDDLLGNDCFWYMLNFELY